METDTKVPGLKPGSISFQRLPGKETDDRDDVYSSFPAHLSSSLETGMTHLSFFLSLLLQLSLLSLDILLQQRTSHMKMETLTDKKKLSARE